MLRPAVILLLMQVVGNPPWIIMIAGGGSSMIGGPSRSLGNFENLAHPESFTEVGIRILLFCIAHADGA